ncbi:MAG: N-acyl-L-amino acid amidohydrolase [Gammaproteobacteria bacterium]|mgnify:FL=1|nr:N-acyl-L-amino acid amidohydrolase [Gammaproteobacteria bacterium]|tara:strand:- start:730 stop:2043 length:1314 start_codon:yes stop_codon:yes gene_type:complete
MKNLHNLILFSLSMIFSSFVLSNTDRLEGKLERNIDSLMEKVIEWRHDIHQYPELSNREFRTAEKVTKHLVNLGLEVETNIAHTGVVAILKGGKPGPMVALRADMDALPVEEMTGLPFASKVRDKYNGLDVGVMHACGHDAHVAILMGVAEFLVSVKNDLAGSVMFIFQPAEEGPPVGEEGGAQLMLKEGIWDEKKPDVIFGLHVTNAPNGIIAYREGASMAAADPWKIVIKGRQAHGSRPWDSIDPIMVAFQLGNNLQTIISRKLDLRESPAVISVGSIHGGVRSNIIPDVVEMEGTIRTFDEAIRDQIFKEMTKIAESTAEMAGASVEMYLPNGQSYPVTFNDEDLTKRVLPSLTKIVGEEMIYRSERTTGAEDFSFFSQQVPGFYFFLGVNKPDADPLTTPGNHSPFFHVDDSALPVGLKALSHLTIEYLNGEI